MSRFESSYDIKIRSFLNALSAKYRRMNEMEVQSVQGVSFSEVRKVKVRELIISSHLKEYSTNKLFFIISIYIFVSIN